MKKKTVLLRGYLACITHKKTLQMKYENAAALVGRVLNVFFRYLIECTPSMAKDSDSFRSSVNVCISCSLYNFLLNFSSRELDYVVENGIYRCCFTFLIAFKCLVPFLDIDSYKCTFW